jgi:competence ComEA-like helix-hairpin-helix protein
MRTIFSKINRHFAFTRKDRNGIYVLLFLIVATIVIRTAYPFWKSLDISEGDSLAAAAISTGGSGLRYGGSGYGRGYSYGNGDGSGQSGRSERSYRDTVGGRSTYTPPSYMQKKAYVVALNSADTFDLKELRGIGSAYSRRIVAYREKLGGFVRKEQLREVWGIDTALYARIAPQITVDASQIRKINLNSASIDVLKRHPYLDYYLAKEIVKHREKYGNFSAVEDLLKVNLIDQATFKRIKPYLMAETPTTSQ